jgi:RNA polymerase sigma factor (sigma-70 family)
MPPEVATDSQWSWVREAIEAHESALIRYARSLLHDGDQARDAVQETFIKLCQKSPEEVADHLAPWLFRVVRNQCLNMLRKENRMSHLEDLDTVNAWDNPAESHPHEQRRREAISSLFELVDTLPNRQRELVLLKFQQDFSYQEISDVTGLSIGNVGFILHQAIRSLKQQWESLEHSTVGGN